MAEIEIKVPGYRCERCGHEWRPRQHAYRPTVCPWCKSAYWDKPPGYKPRGYSGKSRAQAAAPPLHVIVVEECKRPDLVIEEDIWEGPKAGKALGQLLRLHAGEEPQQHTDAELVSWDESKEVAFPPKRHAVPS